jgi:hypothetical protein
MIETTQFGDEAVVSRYEDDGAVVLAADFGPGADASVDVVGDTVITVVDGEQYELDVEGDARAFISNGVLTIEVER